MDDFLRSLIEQEEESIAEVMAFMSYNPSIGRVLQKGGVEKFQRLGVKLAQELWRVQGRRTFDNLHEGFVRRLIANFETARKERVSYGQAQKPINVFLKVYVDWAGRPDWSVRSRLIRHLHVPLDSVLMAVVRKNYPDWYRATIRPYLGKGKYVPTLSTMNKWQYDRWQALFRERSPRKPLMFDVAWALHR